MDYDTKALEILDKLDGVDFYDTVPPTDDHWGARLAAEKVIIAAALRDAALAAESAALERAARKVDEAADGIQDGKLLPSCENPLLVSRGLQVLAGVIRSLIPPEGASLLDEVLRSATEKLEGILDIIIRETEGEDDASLAADYGGTGWEDTAEIQRYRKALNDALRKTRLDEAQWWVELKEHYVVAETCEQKAKERIAALSKKVNQ